MHGVYAGQHAPVSGDQTGEIFPGATVRYLYEPDNNVDCFTVSLQSPNDSRYCPPRIAWVAVGVATLSGLWIRSEFPPVTWAHNALQLNQNPLHFKYPNYTLDKPITQMAPPANWSHANGSVQNCGNSSANALELLQSCTKPSNHCLMSLQPSS